MMFWAVCCVTLAVGSVCTSAAPRSEISHPIDWTQLESAPDDESVDYAVSPGRYPSAPWLYLLAEAPRESQRLVRDFNIRPKRKMPSLSINNPMEVLRQRLLLEVARKQMREANQRQAVANRVFLQNVGKRGLWMNSVSSRYGI
ncbi:diuretic hormone 45 isoform X1 [Pieris rapae]|uniref:diuretic hormone 45 isoform X1 n=1 Tax=Pieris rapae TaxID=64459 RepID=UPI001E28183D|nr:diuretic hormone 45 isoform X1 [Pieris rapae]